jgi:hypothetical protein
VSRVVDEVRGETGDGERGELGERLRGPLDPLLRAGWVAKGVVYVLIGILALQVAFGDGSENADEEGALRTISEQPFGGALLWAVAIGLFLYVGGRLVEAAVVASDREPKERLAIAGSAIAHGSVAVLALSMAIGGGGGGTDEEGLTASVMDMTGGRWLVGLAGIAILAVGAGLIWGAVSKRVIDELDLDCAGGRAEKVVIPLGIIGAAGRGVATGLIGVFVVNAAVQFDPDEAAGLDEALKELAEQPFGQFALALVALGLMAFGAVCILHAKYRRD